MKTTFTIIALLIMFSGPANATDHEQAASNHGYDSAALEVCRGMLTVSNSTLRAKLDRMYRDPNSRWRDSFMAAYAENIDKPTDLMCLTAGNSSWLKLNNAARDQIEVRERKRARDVELK